ncbi:K(+)/H(+) antiporter, partial [Modicella reniformis]
LDPALAVKRARYALGISVAGMALPFGVGAAVSYVLYGQLGPDTNVPFGQFLLFCGVAMSITAFPVLGRILAETKLLTTKVGFLTICAGAVDDIVAWVLLALVISIINSASTITPLYVILLSIAWILVLIFLVRPVFTFMIRITKSQDEPSQGMMAFTMVMVLISAFITDIIGVHAIFGSFLVGLIIPNDTGFAHGVSKRIEDLITVVFLPIYFALSGLKTQIALLDNGETWGLVLLVTFVACFGKIVGCTSAARVQGMEWRESFAIGVLMNCKGLVELIVLNIGYDAGVINATVFVIMVMMCLITTCMTTPLVLWIYPVHYQRAAALRALAKEKAMGDIESPEPQQSPNASKKGIMLCLDKIQNVPAMVSFLDMLHHAISKPQNATTDSVNSAPSPSLRTGPTLFALRLLHLSERSSSVLVAATQRAEVLRRDTSMVIFQAFAKLNNILVQPRMTLSTDPEDFAQSIYDEAVETGTGLIIFPWNSTSLPDPPASNMNDNQDMVLSKPLVTSNTQIVSRLLSTTSTSGVATAIFVDREFGGAGNFMNIMIPLYGSPDDEEALRVASVLSHNKDCKIVIVRIETAMKRKATVDNDVSVDIDAQSVDSEHEHVELPEDNYTLVKEYFPHRAYGQSDKRSGKKNAGSLGIEIGNNIFVEQVLSVQDAIGLSKTLGSRDLLVLGRGSTTRRPAQLPNASPSHAPTAAVSRQPSIVGTPVHQIDNPLGDNSAGVRSRQSLRYQPSLRDMTHSSMTVSNILGAAAQSFLSSEIACCLLAIQSGKRSSGIALSRVASSVRLGLQHTKDLGHSRPFGFESEHSLPLALEGPPTATVTEVPAATTPAESKAEVETQSLSHELEEKQQRHVRIAS